MERKKKKMGAFINQVQQSNTIQKQILTETEQKRKRQLEKENAKIHQFNLKMHLREYFYNEFKQNQGNAENILINFYDLSKRLEVIHNIYEKQKEKTKNDIRDLNILYDKELSIISKIFLNNDKYINKSNEEKDEYYCHTDEEIKQITKDMMEGYEKSLKLEKDNKTTDFLISLFSILIPLAVIGGIIVFLIWGYFHFAVPILNG